MDKSVPLKQISKVLIGIKSDEAGEGALKCLVAIGVILDWFWSLHFFPKSSF